MSNLRYYNMIKKECSWVTQPNPSTFITYKNKNGGSVGFIEYFKATGHIVRIKTEPEYRNMKLGRAMLTDAISDIKPHNDYVWCVAQHNHSFWENVLNHSFTFYKKLPYKQTGMHNTNGYVMKIK
jgi:ribosomal protein S18 acetylase RimI-like enzyme